MYLYTCITCCEFCILPHRLQCMAVWFRLASWVALWPIPWASDKQMNVYNGMGWNYYPWLLFAAFSVESCNGVGTILDVRVNPTFLRETYSLHRFVWKWGLPQMATLIGNMLSHEPSWTSLLVSDCPTPDPWRFGILLPWHRNMEDMEGMLRHRWIRWS